MNHYTCTSPNTTHQEVPFLFSEASIIRIICLNQVFKSFIFRQLKEKVDFWDDGAMLPFSCCVWSAWHGCRQIIAAFPAVMLLWSLHDDVLSMIRPRKLVLLVLVIIELEANIFIVNSLCLLVMNCRKWFYHNSMSKDYSETNLLFLS